MARQVTAEVLHDVEGWEGCVLYSYDDAIFPTRPALPGEVIRGTLTAGSGHTGPDVFVGQRITQAEADAWLEADMARSAANVEREVKVALNDNQFGAISSFDFNAGDGALDQSTLLKKLNAGDYASVPAQLARWNKTEIAGKLVLSQGLVTRRAAEAALFTRGMPVSGVVPAPPSSLHPATVPTTICTGAVIAGSAAIAHGVPWPWIAAAVIVFGIGGYVVSQLLKGKTK